MCICVYFFFQAEDGIRDLVRSRGLGDVYKRQSYTCSKQDKNYVLRIVLAENKLSSKVTGGQHAGKVLLHDAVVRILFSVNNPSAKGQAAIPLKEFKTDSNFSWTAFVQHKQTMKILGASRLN